LKNRSENVAAWGWILTILKANIVPLVFMSRSGEIQASQPDAFAADFL
jgi:hypothetical protein